MEQQETTTSTTTPSPVPSAAAAAAASAAAQPASVAAAAQADVFPSPPRSQPTSLGHQPSVPPVRILGRNVNGTVVQTSMPQNEAELQLYRVMQRASLLSYYDTLLEMGGDDVQQLCDAGEEEFLEIMALVGMASKPLHVRRLQKALQEWLTNPAMFQTPVLAPPSATGSGSSSGSKTPVVAPVVFPCIGSYSPNTRQQIQSSAKLHSTATATPPVAQPLAQFSAVSVATATASCCPVQRRKSLSPQPFVGMQQMQQAMSSQSQQAETPPAGAATVSTGAALLQGNLPLLHSPGIVQTGNYESSSCGSQGTTPSPSSNNAMVTAPQSPTAVLQQSPILLESQVQRLAEAAERLAATIRPLNPKPQSGIKKKMCKNLELVMAMPDSDPRRMEEIRKYAAIYGRFDCKRKPEKPLTLHEVSVNEAAAQICRFVPALLTRRDELFPLARRVVRDSGHYYTKNMLHSASNTPPRTMSSRENGDGDLSGGDEASILTGTAASDLVKRRKLELRCEDDSVAGNRDNSTESGQQQQQQAESTRLRSSSYSRTVAIDSDSNSLQLLQNRHRKRQRRRRPSKLGRKSMSSPVWQSCSENSNIVLDGVGEDFEDSDGCYSSFDDWDDCNEDDCEENFGIDTDEGGGDDGDENPSTATPMIHDSQNQEAAEQDDPSCMMDKENDFNLKVIASCGDNIIAVANPALMNRNQSAAITKEPPIKEEITLRDRRD